MFCDQILYPPRPAGPSRKVGWIISTFLDIAKILKWNYLLVQKRPQEENYWKGQKKTQWSKKQLLLLNNLESIYIFNIVVRLSKSIFRLILTYEDMNMYIAVAKNGSYEIAAKSDGLATPQECA